jgi:hypothetical protein
MRALSQSPHRRDIWPQARLPRDSCAVPTAGAKEAATPTSDPRMATKKIATAMGSCGSDDGGSEAALAGAEKAPEAVSNPNMVAKRTATVTGSSGSSPPRKRFHTTSTYQDPWYVMHFEVILFLLFCVGLLIPVSALQGVEPKRHAFSPGVWSPWHFQGWCPPRLSDTR